MLIIRSALLPFFLVTLLTHAGLAQRGSGQPATSIHFRPAHSKAGDVIPFYYKGEYHVFYMRDNNWGHIVSRDLVRWKELPDAIKPGADPLGADGEGCWTGSIVENQGLFYLFYTGKNSKDPKGDQKVMLATSKDLIYWTKEPRHTFYADGNFYWNKTLNGPIDDRQNYHHQAFRDPDVFWNTEKNEWWMLLHAVGWDGSAPAMGLYTSKDLINWKASKPLLVYPSELSGDCPYVFPSKGKWFLNFADYHYKTANRLEGPYDSPVKAFDCGDLRVPKLMWDGRRFVLTGWVMDYEGNVDSGQVRWGGTLCMPRELWTDSAGNEYQRPLPEVINAFRSADGHKYKQPVRSVRVKVPENFMFHTQFEPETPGTTVVIRFPQTKTKADKDYHLKIDIGNREVELGSNYKSYKRTCDIDPSKPIDVRIFWLGDMLECFVNDAWAFTMRAYEKQAGDLSIGTQNGAINVRSYEVFYPPSDEK